MPVKKTITNSTPDSVQNSDAKTPKVSDTKAVEAKSVRSPKASAKKKAVVEGDIANLGTEIVSTANDSIVESQEAVTPAVVDVVSSSAPVVTNPVTTASSNPPVVTTPVTGVSGSVVPASAPRSQTVSSTSSGNSGMSQQGYSRFSSQYGSSQGQRRTSQYGSSQGQRGYGNYQNRQRSSYSQQSDYHAQGQNNAFGNSSAFGNVSSGTASIGGMSSYSAPVNNNASMAGVPNDDMSQGYSGDVVSITGMLEVLPEYGVIRQRQRVDENLPRDVYISHSQIKRFNLRMGDFIKGFARPPKEGERYLSLLKIESVEGFDPELAKKRPQFGDLTAIFPNKWLKLETTTDVLATRLLDLVAPIGRGQRAMIVAPPKAGKTWLLKDIANGITTNYPDIILLVALIGERPEEVTHFSRSVKGEVFSSNFDEKAEEQTRISELCLERAKRLVERGKDVVILMDSLTRLARAYNMVAPPSGRTLTGGFDPAALYPAKHFFGAARNVEEGGSLTIIATALVDTGSRMDDVIFEEFKGTGNMELRLDSALYERRIFPTIDIKSSGTRHEEHLLGKDTMDQIIRLRRMVDLLDDKDATELVIERLKKFKSNKDFLENLHKGV